MLYRFKNFNHILIKLDETLLIILGYRDFNVGVYDILDVDANHQLCNSYDSEDRCPVLTIGT